MMRRLFFALGLTSLLTLAVSGTAGAVTAADWHAGRIIDDVIFQNANSMSVQEIQQFLNTKLGTACDTNGAQNVTYRYPFGDTNAPYVTTTRAVYAQRKGNHQPTGTQIFTCLKDYYEVPRTAPSSDPVASNYGFPNPQAAIPAGAKSAAQIIYDAAHASNISPKVLLDTLQKEQGLITDDWPVYNEYLYAMGAHCPDSGPGGSANCDTTYAGFSLQMYEGASLFRYYFDNMSQPWWPYKKPNQTNTIQWTVSAACGSSPVFIENMATAALYTYTPYQPNKAALDNMYSTGDSCSSYGNRNFWRTFNDWFGDTLYRGIPNAHPDGSLIKYDGNPTVFLIENGVKRPFLLEQSLYSYGYSSKDISAATYYDAFLYQGDPVPLFRPGQLIKGSGPAIYSFQINASGASGKQYFGSWQDFSSLGNSLSKVMTVSDGIINQLADFGPVNSTRHPNGDIIKDPNGPTVYYISNEAKLYSFTSADAFTSNRLSFSDVKTATTADLALPVAGTVNFREGTILKTSSSPAIYVVDLVNGVTTRRALASINCFDGFGYKMSEDVFNTSTDLMNSLPEGNPSCTWQGQPN
jgi:hypothetical protein